MFVTPYNHVDALIILNALHRAWEWIVCIIEKGFV